MVTHLIRLEDFRPQFPKPHLLLAVSRSVFVETEIVTNSCNKPKILYSTCHAIKFRPIFQQHSYCYSLIVRFAPTGWSTLRVTLGSCLVFTNNGPW